jgi:DNA-binding CsgD family transcriptional regulator
VSIEDVRAGIEELLAARLVRSGSTPIGVVAIDPTPAIERHITRVEREVARQAEGFAELRTLIPALADEYAHGRAAHDGGLGFETIMGLDDVRREVYLAHEQTKAHSRSLDHSTAVGGMRHARQVDLNALARGVRERSIFATSTLTEPDMYAELEVLHQHGHLIRTLPDVPTRMLVLDRDLAILPINPSDLSVGAVFIRVQSVIDALIYMFDRLWSEADPVFTTPNDTNAPTGRRARVLELVAIGTKDDRIARALGVGVRTVRRDIADLRKTLAVSSRAEIVAGAIRKGWL